MTRRSTKNSRKIVGVIMSANPSNKVLLDEYDVTQACGAVAGKKYHMG